MTSENEIAQGPSQLRVMCDWAARPHRLETEALRPDHAKRTPSNRKSEGARSFRDVQRRTAAREGTTILIAMDHTRALQATRENP